MSNHGDHHVETVVSATSPEDANKLWSSSNLVAAAAGTGSTLAEPPTSLRNTKLFRDPSLESSEARSFPETAPLQAARSTGVCDGTATDSDDDYESEPPQPTSPRECVTRMGCLLEALRDLQMRYQVPSARSLVPFYSTSLSQKQAQNLAAEALLMLKDITEGIYIPPQADGDSSTSSTPRGPQFARIGGRTIQLVPVTRDAVVRKITAEEAAAIQERARLASQSK